MSLREKSLTGELRRFWRQAEHTKPIPPFRSQQANELIDGVEKFLGAAKNHLPRNLTAVAGELERIKGSAARWTPVYHLAYDMTDGRKRNWRIIERYPEWERRGMAPGERFDEYLQHFGERPPLDKKVRSDAINAFGHRCRFLRCRCTVKAKRRWIGRRSTGDGM
jgi:hypothetical protein